jgi:hypothetical protein
MRKRLPLSSLLAIALALAMPAGVAAQVPGDSVIGSGTLLQPPSLEVGFDLEARSGPSGENPNGRFALIFQDGFRNEGTIVCLRVSGSTAVFGADFSGGLDACSRS